MTSTVGSAQTPVELITTFMERFNQGDAAGMCALFAPDGIVHEADSLMWGGDWTGPEGFAELLSKMNGPTAINVEQCSIYDCGDFVAMKMLVSFTSRASGRQLRMPVVEFYSVVGGLIREVEVLYQDTAAVNDLVRNG